METVSDTNPGPEIGEMLRLLADDHRRGVLHHLRDEGASSVEELAEYLVGRPAEETLGRDALRETIVELHHTHLPKLRDAGAIRYDESQMTAELGARADALLPVLDAVEEIDEFAEAETEA